MRSRTEEEGKPVHAPGQALRGGVGVLVLALGLYLWTLDSGIAPYELLGGDLITHQYAQVQARFSNAPGYPLYTMGGWLWFHALKPLLSGVANPVQVLSSYSTFWALVALALLYALLLQVTRRNVLLSTLVTLAYATTYFFWYYAVTTEQYTSAVAHTLAIVLVAFRWEETHAREERDRAGPVTYLQPVRGAGRLFLLLAFLLGLALAHMITVLLIAPPLAWFILRTDRGIWKRRGLLARALLSGILPLLAYTYVYARGAQHPEWRGEGTWPNTLSWFLDFLSTRQGWDELTWILGGFTEQFPSLIWQELTWPVLLLGLVGLARLSPRRAALLYGMLLLYLLFSYVDRLGNWYQVIMPAYPLLFLGLAALLQDVWDRVGFSSRSLAHATRGLLVLALFLLLVNRLVVNYARADQSHRPIDTGLDPGWRLLADAPAPNAAIFGVLEEKLALDYITIIWGYRPDVRAVTAPEAAQILRDGSRPLYVSLQAAPLFFQEMKQDVSVLSGGLYLLRVGAPPLDGIPPDARPLDIYFGNQVRLVGYALSPPPRDIPLPLPWRLTLYWQASGPQPSDWSVSVRPTRGEQFIYLDGSLVQSDHAHPAHGYRPTSAWKTQEIVRDDYPIPSDPRLDFDGITVILYRALGEGKFENLGSANFNVEREPRH